MKIWVLISVIYSMAGATAPSSVSHAYNSEMECVQALEELNTVALEIRGIAGENVGIYNRCVESTLL